MIDVASAILTGIVIAAVSSLITVKLSLGKFRTQWWWERKAEAYTKVIEALHNAKAFADGHLTYRGSELPEEQDKELRRRSKLAHDEIDKVMDTGAFLLSEMALERLRQYQKDARRATETTNWVEYLDADWAATETCLKDMIKIAKTDLQVK